VSAVLVAVALVGVLGVAAAGADVGFRGDISEFSSPPNPTTYSSGTSLNHYIADNIEAVLP
jgi:hypothetical protein